MTAMTIAEKGELQCMYNKHPFFLKGETKRHLLSSVFIFVKISLNPQPGPVNDNGRKE